ncbi:MAG: UvrD-helicase domain-containing protein [Acidimicrobiales bacterium]
MTAARRATGPLDDAQLFPLDDDPPAAPAEGDAAPAAGEPAGGAGPVRPPLPPHLPEDPTDEWGAGPGVDGERRERPARPARRPIGDPAPLLEGLNPEQRAAVVHRGGPLLVVAGAGSGKTRVLTRRIAHLLATGDASPHEILAITFTNKAADEMRRRVVELVGPRAERMWVSTFHSACLRILRSHAGRLGYRPAFTVYDDLDSRRLVELVMAELGIDTKRLPPRSVAAVIGRAKAELTDPGRFRDETYAADPLRRRIADVYAEYQRRLVAANAMDFDDLLMTAVAVLERCDDVLEAYQQRFRHVLVDEYQDTNRAQNELVTLLGRAHHNVCVVGDGDQSIYGFRAADVRNILEFEQAFPDAVTISLEQNYRSTQTILDAANAVIAQNQARRPKRLFTQGERGDPIVRYRAEDEHDEAAFVAHEVLRLRRDEHLSLGDVAVFYRTNAQSRVLEEELVHAGVAYKVIGGTRFYDRKEVKDLLAYLRLLTNPADEVSARRVVNVPKRGIGATSVSRLAAWAATAGVGFAEALGRAEEAGLGGKALKGAADLGALLDELRGAMGGVSPGDLVQLVAERTGYLAELVAQRSHEADGRIENIAELVTVAGEYDDLSELLETVALVSDADDLDDVGARVSLMTLHTAKGLEFPVVFLVGLEDGVFPHFRALGEPLELEEERRLCYVGITRARRFLYLTHAWVRHLWGTTSHNIPSRFLAEVPAELISDVGVIGGRRGDGGRRRRDDEPWEAGPAGGTVFGSGRGPTPPPRRERQSTGAEALGLAAGDQVVHERWGDGVVLSTAGAGDRAQARVRFASVGEKNLLLSATPLRRA